MHFVRDGEVVARGLVDLDSLDPAGQLKFLVIFHLFFGHVELVHSHERKGMLDPDLLNRTYTSLYAYYRLPGVKQWWERMGRGQFSSEFGAFVEDPNESGLRNVPAVPTDSGA